MEPPTFIGPPPVPFSQSDCEELAREFGIDGLRLTSAGHVLVVQGHVHSYSAKRDALMALERGARPMQVVNRLRVVPHVRRPDGELLGSVRKAIDRSVLTATDIEISVSHGSVNLRGFVASSEARCAAEQAVWAVRGVVDIMNDIVVKEVT